MRSVRLPLFCLLVSALFSSATRAQGPAAVPIFKIIRAQSTIRFGVKASVAIDGTFDGWDAALTFASTDPTTGVLDLKIRAASVNTGSGMKNDRLKSKDFFNANQDPLITFLSKKMIRTSPHTYEVDGDFTIRGVTRAEKLTLTVTSEGKGLGLIVGTMAFDRKEYGMDSGIPFIRIADRVEVTVDLKAERISGPPVIYDQ